MEFSSQYWESDSHPLLAATEEHPRTIFISASARLVVCLDLPKNQCAAGITKPL